MNRIPPNHLIPPSSVFSNIYLRELALEFGTPLFVYDFALLRAAFDELSSLLPEETNILYSVKSNPSLAILEYFAGIGAGFEVASIGELLALERCGIDASRAIFVGPGKRQADLVDALERGLGWLVVDSVLEYSRVLETRMSERLGSLAVRVNPTTYLGHGGLLNMSGQTPFGMTEPEALKLLRLSVDGWPILGFHGYLGSQILDADAIVANTALLLEIASRLQEQSGVRLSFIDVGGGFGVPLYARDKEFDRERLADGLRQLVREFRRKCPWTETIAFESGRFLSARAGVFLSTVLDCKERDGEFFVVLDGGVSSIGGRDGYAGARLTPLRLLAECDETVSATLCGPLCTPMDRVAARITLPRPEPGQVFAFFLAGAYAYSASPGMFLSHGYAAEVGVKDGKARLLRPRQDPDAILGSQVTYWS